MWWGNQAGALKINPQQPPCYNEASRADWAAFDTLAVSRYCLCVSALPDVQQPYGAATRGNRGTLDVNAACASARSPPKTRTDVRITPI